MSKFETPYHDVVHGIPAEYEAHLDEVKERLSDFIEELSSETIAAKKIELGKTKKDKQIIDFTSRSVDEYLAKYGRKKIIEIPLKNIQLVPVGGTKKITDGKLEEAAASSIDDRLIVDRDPSDVVTALRLFHEFVHLKSFKALKINLAQGVDVYRSGIAALSKKGDKKYFVDIEEAVVGLLTRRFYEEKIKGNRFFAGELSKRQEAYDTSRPDEVVALEALIEELWSKNQSQFKSKAEIEGVFIEAQVNGHLLKLAHLIKQSRGPKSFRKLAENTQET